ncbi:hypothetical protein CXB51_031376 [Gossypium anomalum]|uniref:Cytochrome P450 n=1 Tax=Gossypium anomalum TaxID=47600 RepID=A0A8J6CGV0_9ROSI|nr:hypothetical protein CXB51_031376 [Gossypium anomalum]
MEESITLYSFLSFIFFIICLNLFLQSRRHRKNLPPSPPSLPIVGHLHLLKPPIHRLHQSFSQKYGPIFSLKLGSRLMVVVSSSTAAEECLIKNDIIFANRPKLIIAKHLGYNYTTLVSSSYGDHWRNLRRIGATEIFSSGRLNASVNVRKDETRRLMLSLSTDSRQDFVKVELKSMLSDLTFNNIMRMLAGKRYYGDEVTNEEEAREFRELMVEVAKNSGTGNPADYLPVLNWFGLGFEGKLKKLGKRLDGFLQKLVDDHRSNKLKNNSMIDHLLSMQESDPLYYTDEIIKGFIMVILFAGTDTSSVTMEWAMANLLNHPQVLKKARDEIDSLIGEEKLIEESDVPKLHYLQSIIYETLRLYPAAPLLVPHMPSTDCSIGGYDVPSGTIVLVNAWAIHRDPNVWDDSTSFKPERFDGNSEKIEHSQKLLPFGLGRRACPGANLAQRMVGLTLGSLIQCFEWERIEGKEIDMSEGKGTITPKLHPLEALCKARPIVDKLFY